MKSVTWKEYVDRRFEEKELRDQQRFEAQEEARKSSVINVKEELKIALDNTRSQTDERNRAIEKRFEGVNEFRGVLSDQTKTFITRDEAQQATRSNVDKIDLHSSRLDKLEGRHSGMTSSWGYIIAAIGLIIALIAIYFK